MLKRLNAAALLICLPASLLQAQAVTPQNKPESAQQTGQQASQTTTAETPRLQPSWDSDLRMGRLSSYQVAPEAKLVVRNGQKGRYG